MNSLVYDTAILYLQAEVCTGQPWPSSAVMENKVEWAWALALEQRMPEKAGYYRSDDQRPVEEAPSLLPDAVLLQLVIPLT